MVQFSARLISAVSLLSKYTISNSNLAVFPDSFFIRQL